ncbi:hypothetical protein MACH26_38480 [Planctobacterium marinum]|uniref:diguanylate cyclase n=1 Tax=Planctobacterium marinum TaxID=1631968 RepID=A0AA48KTM2_9ALTE|nr:hypothetical protein MACH26_38480 [Planctobacterium marinum]
MLPGLPPKAYSSSELFELGEWYFESFEELEDLGIDVITVIIQDQRGFIWLGAQSGLVRYDGYEFKKYMPDPQNPHAISGRYIQSITEIGEQIWVGTYSDGLSIYNPDTDSFTSYSHDREDPLSLADNDVRAIVPVGEHVFLGTRGGINIFTRDGRSLGIVQVRGCENVLSKGRVNTLFSEANNLWIGTVNGLCRLNMPGFIDAGQIWQGTELKEFDGHNVYYLAVDYLKQIWVGTTNFGAAVIQPGSLTVTAIPYDPNDPSKVNAPWVDEMLQVDDEVWLATATAGIAVVDAKTLQVKRHIRRQEGIPNTLTLDDISAFLQDDSGLIWIGTWGGGLNRFNPANKAFRSLRPNHLKTNTLTHPDIRAIEELQNGEIWVGSFVNGIDVINPEHGVIRGFRPDQTDPLALQGGYVFSIEQMPDGDIWVATLDHGIFRYLPEVDGFRQFVDHPELPDNTVRTLLAEGERWLWVGTDAGLSLMDTQTETLQSFKLQDVRGQTFDKVIESIVVFGGVGWIATNQGLYIADRETMTVVPVVSPKGRGLADNFITDIHISSDNHLYFANSLGFDRLTAWDPTGINQGEVTAEFESIAAKIGRPGERLGNNILEDNSGRLWVKNSVVDPSDWSLTRIDKSAGWDVGNMWIGSNHKLRDGTLMFGGTRGILLIRPELYETWTFEPRLVVTAIARDSEKVAPADAKPLVLTPEVESFYIEFAALDYSGSERLQYQYKMQGYDSNWINTSARNRRATYSRLQPGEYQLQVRGTNKEGIWSNQMVTVDILQRPAWYETWWFRTIAALVISMLLFGFYSYRVTMLNRQKQALDKLVASRTADIELLGKIGKDITSSLDLEEVMNAVNRHVSKLIDTQVFLMGFVDEDKQLIKIQFLKEDGIRCQSLEYELSEHNRPAVWCVQNKAALITNNRLELLDYVEEIQQPKFGETMESIVYLPLVIHDKVVGCLSLQSPKQNAYTENDIEVLQKVASYAAIALDNAESHSKLESALSEIERISLTDQLTGAKNRRFLENIMPVEMARIKRARADNSPIELGFVLLDIDHFKAVNDTWGHDVGDQLLTQFVELLHKLCRESDWVVRLGGEEFVVVAQIEEEGQLAKLAERLRKGVQEFEFAIDADLVLQKTCSIGLVTVPFVNGDFSKINWQKCLNIADRALYAAKNNGRNAWVAIFANQSLIEADIYDQVLKSPDKLREEGRITCVTSFAEDKSWRFNQD